MNTTNTNRALRSRQLVTYHMIAQLGNSKEYDTDNDLPDSIVSLLSDLLHLCGQRGLGIQPLITQATLNHQEESNGCDNYLDEEATKQNADGGDACDDLRDMVLESYKAVAGDGLHPGIEATAQHMYLAILARDGAKLIEILDPSNKVSRKAFQHMFSGRITLPRTIKGTKEIVDGFIAEIEGKLKKQGSKAALC